MKIVISYTLLVVSVLLFFFYLFRYTLAVPELDDFFAIIGFVNDFLNSQRFDEKVTLLYGQIAEHRIVVNRLLNLLLYALTGKIQMGYMVYIANLTLLFLLFVFYRSFQIKKDKIWYFLPVCFFTLQQQYNEITLSATASSQHTTVLLFAFLAFYFLGKPTQRQLYWAIVCAVLATFTSANGIFTFLIGCLCLLIQKRWRDSVIWVLWGAGVVFVYFVDYQHYGHLRIASIWESTLDVIEYALHFIGAGLHISRFGYAMAVFTGISVVSWLVYLFFRQYYLKNIELSGVLLFLLLTATLISLGRFEMGFAYRYNLYSAVFLSVAYMSWVEIASQKWIQRLQPLVLLISILFSLFSYYDYTAFAETVRREKVANIFNLMHQKEALINYFYGGFLVKAKQENINTVVGAEEKGIYQLPKHPIMQLEAALRADNYPTDAKWSKNITITNTDTLLISNTDFQINNDTDDAVYLIIKSKAKSYLLMTFSEKNSFLTYIKTGFYYKAGFSTQIVKNILNNESYRLGLVWIKDNKTHITWTDKQIN